MNTSFKSLVAVLASGWQQDHDSHTKIMISLVYQICMLWLVCLRNEKNEKTFNFGIFYWRFVQCLQCVSNNWFSRISYLMISLISGLQSGLGSSYVMQSWATQRTVYSTAILGKKKVLNYLYVVRDFSLYIAEPEVWSVV